MTKTSGPLFSRQEKLLLMSLALVQFCHIVDFMIMPPLGPTIMRIFEINPHQFGILVSSYTFAAGVSGLAASLFIDRFDRKRSLLFFFFGFCIGTLACGLSETYQGLLLSRTLTGLFGGVLGSLVLSIVGDAISPERRGSAMGIIMMSFSMASVFGVPLSLYLSQKMNWHAPFVVLGGTSLLLTALINFGVPSMKKHLSIQSHTSPLQTIAGILTTPDQVLAIVFVMLLILGQFAIIPFYSPSLVANGGLTEAQLPLIYTVGGLISIVSAPLIGRMSDRFGKKQVFTIGAAFSLIPFFLATNLGIAPLWYILLITVLFFLTMGGRMIPAQAMITGVVPPEHRGAFMSLSSSAIQFSSALASYIAGLVIVKSADGRLMNYDFVGYAALILTLISLVLVRRIKLDVS